MVNEDQVTIVHLKANWHPDDRQVRDCPTQFVCKRVILRYQITDKDFPDSKLVYPIDKKYASLVMLSCNDYNQTVLDWKNAKQSNSEVIFNVHDNVELYSDLRFQVILKVEPLQRIANLHVEVWVDEKKEAKTTVKCSMSELIDDIADLQVKHKDALLSLELLTDSLHNKMDELQKLLKQNQIGAKGKLAQIKKIMDSDD